MFLSNEKPIQDFNKHQNSIIKGIKEKIDSFLSEFNEYFHHNIFNKYTEEIEGLFDQKYKKYLEIMHNFEEQLKEMELLLSSTEKDDPNAGSIKENIKFLKEEQQLKINENDEYFKKI